MEWLLYHLGAGILAGLQLLPLRVLARLGRMGGHLAWWFDRRHREVALENLQACFGAERSPEALRAIARENLCRIGENFACAIKTAVMGRDAIRGVLEIEGMAALVAAGGAPASRGVVVAIGHFGNFELFAQLGFLLPGRAFATTYRALRHPVLNRLMQSLRERTGCLFFERRQDAEALKQAMHRDGGLLLGLLADQHGGRHGLWGPFLGRDCSTTPAPAVLALRYRYALLTATCYRVGLARWRIEVGEEIPTRSAGRPRPVEAIMADVNQVFERSIRRDPANWFWVHRRWKPRVREAAAAEARAKGRL